MISAPVCNPAIVYLLKTCFDNFKRELLVVTLIPLSSSTESEWRCSLCSQSPVHGERLDCGPLIKTHSFCRDFRLARCRTILVIIHEYFMRTYVHCYSPPPWIGSVSSTQSYTRPVMQEIVRITLPTKRICSSIKVSSDSERSGFSNEAYTVHVYPEH